LTKTVEPDVRFYSVAFSPDGHTFATGDNKGLVRLWNSADGAEKSRFKDQSVKWLTYSPDGTMLASATNGKVKVREMRSGKVLHELTGREAIDGFRQGVRGIAYSPSGALLAAVSADGFGGTGAIQVWDAPTGAELLSIASSDRAYYAVTFSREEKYLIVGCSDGRIQVAALAPILSGTKKERAGISSEKRIRSVESCRDRGRGRGVSR
jgi:WD40 repeat protein